MTTAYATRPELATLGGTPASVLAQFTADKQDAALAQASTLLDSFIGNRYAVPLVSWGDDVKINVCVMAVYLLMSELGIPPDSNDAFRARYDDVVAWARLVGRGDAVLINAVDQTPGKNEDAPAVMSCDRQRGW